MRTHREVSWALKLLLHGIHLLRANLNFRFDVHVAWGGRKTQSPDKVENLKEGAPPIKLDPKRLYPSGMGKPEVSPSFLQKDCISTELSKRWRTTRERGNPDNNLYHKGTLKQIYCPNSYYMNDPKASSFK